jgi:hypothetical protein
MAQEEVTDAGLQLGGAGQSKQVVYGTNDGHIHELFVIKGGTWQYADLIAITGAP